MPAKPVLLVVDDDAEARRLLVRDLERAYGERYRVLGAASGREALERLAQLKRDNEPVALVLAARRMEHASLREMLVPLVPAAVIALGLIVAQPDLGQTVSLAIILLGLLW